MKKIVSNMFITIIWFFLFVPVIGLIKGVDITNINIIHNKELLYAGFYSLIISTLSALLIVVLGVYLSIYYYKNNINANFYTIFIIPLFVFIFVKLFNLKYNFILLIICYVLMFLGIVVNLFIKYLSKNKLNKNSNYVLVLKKPIMLSYVVLNIIILNESLVSVLLFNNKKVLSSFLYNSLMLKNYSDFYNGVILEIILIGISFIVYYMVSYEKKLRGQHEKN